MKTLIFIFTLFSCISFAQNPVPPATVKVAVDGCSSTPVAAVINPQNAVLAVGTRQQYSFILTFSDGSTMPVSAITQTPSWYHVSNPWVASVDANGLVTPLSSGTVTIDVWSGSMFSTTAVTVNSSTPPPGSK